MAFCAIVVILTLVNVKIHSSSDQLDYNEADDDNSSIMSSEPSLISEIETCASYHSEYGDARIRIQDCLDALMNNDPNENFTTFFQTHLDLIKSVSKFQDAFVLRMETFKHCLKWIIRNKWIKQFDDNQLNLQLFHSIGHFKTRRWSNYLELRNDTLFISNLHVLCMESDNYLIIKQISVIFRKWYFNPDQISAIYDRMNRLSQEKDLRNTKWMNLYIALSRYSMKGSSDNGLIVAMPLLIHHQMIHNLIRFASSEQ